MTNYSSANHTNNANNANSANNGKNIKTSQQRPAFSTIKLMVGGAALSALLASSGCATNELLESGTRVSSKTLTASYLKIRLSLLAVLQRPYLMCQWRVW